MKSFCLACSKPLVSPSLASVRPQENFPHRARSRHCPEDGFKSINCHFKDFSHIKWCPPWNLVTSLLPLVLDTTPLNTFYYWNLCTMRAPSHEYDQILYPPIFNSPRSVAMTCGQGNARSSCWQSRIQTSPSSSSSGNSALPHCNTCEILPLPRSSSSNLAPLSSLLLSLSVLMPRGAPIYDAYMEGGKSWISTHLGIWLKGFLGKFWCTSNVGRACRTGFRPNLPERRNVPRKPLRTWQYKRHT